MAKSKNHTNHNQSMTRLIINPSSYFSLDRKDHRNGIKRPKSQRFPSLSGVGEKKEISISLN